MRLVLEWVYAGNSGIYSSLEKVREEGERLIAKTDMGKAHSKQRTVYAMARRCGGMSVQTVWLGHRKPGRRGEGCWRGRRPMGQVCRGVGFQPSLRRLEGALAARSSVCQPV